MAFRYSRSAMTGAAIFTLAGVTVLPLAQANAAPASPQDEARSGSTQSQPNSAAQNGQDQGQQQGANANGQGQQGANASDQSQNGATQGGATQDPSQAASGGEQQQGQPSASQDKQGSNVGGQSQQQGANANAQGQQQAQPSASQDKQGSNVGGQSQQQSANGQGQQAQGQQQGAPASQSSSNSKSASQNNQSRQSQPSAPANQNSGFIAITSVDGFIDPQNTDNVLSVETTGIDNTHRVQYEPRVQELDEFGNIVNDDVSNGGGSSLGSDGSFGMYVSVDGTKINPNHQYRVYIDVFDQDTLTASYAYYPIVVWNRTYIPVVPLSAAR